MEYRKKACEKQKLWASEACLIEYCNCKKVHLTVGPVTLRLEPDHFERIAVALLEVLRYFDHQHRLRLQ